MKKQMHFCILSIRIPGLTLAFVLAGFPGCHCLQVKLKNQWRNMYIYLAVGHSGLHGGVVLSRPEARKPNPACNDI